MKRRYIIMGALALTMPLVHVQADDFFDDDIYYNPSKEKKVTTKSSSYIANFDDLDVDTYNRRGQYYMSPIDTVGERVGMEEDFVYTQQLQKFYNPTIVVENADVLADILENSYGNVDIVIDNGNINFAPAYLTNSYYGFYSPWNWPYTTWGWGIGYYDPWYSPWGWGVSYSWYPGWSWGPSWGYGPGWNWGWGPSYVGPAITHRPAGNHRVGASAGWASTSRPSVGSNRTLHGNPGNNRYSGSIKGNSNYGRAAAGNQRTYRGSESSVNSMPTSSGNNRIQTDNRTTVTNNRNNYTPSRNTSQNRSAGSYNKGSRGSEIRNTGSLVGNRGGG
ncbi:MAG: hypothetical protein K2K26_05375, partial [Muribaculaceae bacterium]|nr:hypothetical protein [Muribaculaceae bacterium]